MPGSESARMRITSDGSVGGGQWAILGNVKVLSHFALFFHGTPFSLSLPAALLANRHIHIFISTQSKKRERETAQELRLHVVCDALRMFARDVDWHCPIPYPLSQREWVDRCRGVECAGWLSASRILTAMAMRANRQKRQQT